MFSKPSSKARPYREGRGKVALPARPPLSDFEFGFSEDRNIRKRLTMEDSHSFFYDFNGVKNQGLFCIFDGHGGKSAADWCGEHFHQIVAQLLDEHPSRPVPELFDMAFRMADSHLVSDNEIFSGTTAVVALIRDEGRDDATKKVLYTANAGDARAVLCRGGRAVRLTYDHKGSEPQEQQRVRDAGGFIALDRVSGMLAITRALGDQDLKDFVTGRPFTAEVVLDPSQDTHLIMACDGLWDVVEDQEACDFIPDDEDIQEAADLLTDFAMEQGSTDNISVLLARFLWDATAAVSTAEKQADRLDVSPSAAA